MNGNKVCKALPNQNEKWWWRNDWFLEGLGRDPQGCPEQGLSPMVLRKNNVAALSSKGYTWFPRPMFNTF